MKILVVSDTHRKLENLKVILEREQPMDLLIHLGDAEGDEDSIAEMAGCRLEIVAGNNDFFSNLPREKELRIGSYRVLDIITMSVRGSPILSGKRRHRAMIL